VFVETLLDRYPSIALAEIGSTWNRRKWAGLPRASYLAFWRAAHESASRREIPVAGPNVSDFEPFWNAGLLQMLQDQGVGPDWHSFDLLTERAGEPENWDPKVLGRRLAPVLKLDLVKKARLLASMSSRFGISRTMSSHSCWSLRRIGRLTDDVEEKQADYLARYCCLAAASGALSRLYWGPLIGQREGLIDDGTTEYPARPHVAFYGQVPGQVSNYRRRPAFHAFEAVTRLLRDSRCLSKSPSRQELQIHEFESRDRVVHAVWTRDRRRAVLSNCYDGAALASACILTRDGTAVLRLTKLINESPLYLSWPKAQARTVRENARVLADLTFSRSVPDSIFLAEDRSGASTAPTMVTRLPDTNEGWTTLRNGRNRVLLGKIEGVADSVVVKQFGKKNRSRALRSWNAANELIRRGIPTPEPVGFSEAKDSVPSWYACRQFDGMPVRRVFEALAAGSASYVDVPAREMFRAIVACLAHMHRRGVYFRDLSAGNLLVAFRPGPEELEFALIDTARARFRVKAVSRLDRMNDLKRLVHPLDWRSRRELLDAYRDAADVAPPVWLTEVLFAAYDFKHWVKNQCRW